LKKESQAENRGLHLLTKEVREGEGKGWTLCGEKDHVDSGRTRLFLPSRYTPLFPTTYYPITRQFSGRCDNGRCAESREAGVEEGKAEEWKLRRVEP